MQSSLIKLKSMRWMFPGLYIGILIYINLNKYIPDTNPFLDFRLYLGSVVFATLYAIFGMRNVIWYKGALDKIIDYNICIGMEEINNNMYVENEKNAIKLGVENAKYLFVTKRYYNKRMKNTFFKYVNESEQLKIESTRIMFNGFLLTSLIDIIIITFLVTIINLFLFAFGIEFPLMLEIMYLIITLVSCFLFIIVLGRHLEMSNKQLIIINETVKSTNKTS